MYVVFNVCVVCMYVCDMWCVLYVGCVCMCVVFDACV